MTGLGILWLDTPQRQKCTQLTGYGIMSFLSPKFITVERFSSRRDILEALVKLMAALAFSDTKCRYLVARLSLRLVSTMMIFPPRRVEFSALRIAHVGGLCPLTR